VGVVDGVDVGPAIAVGVEVGFEFGAKDDDACGDGAIVDAAVGDDVATGTGIAVLG
jgi:hypothetical protein